MNWSYAAGLFDGKGCVSIGFNHKGSYWIITPMIIFSGSSTLMENLKNFLERENVKANISKSSPSKLFPEAKGTYSIYIIRWEGCKRVCSYIWDEVIEKKPVIELLRKAIELHTECIRRRRIGGKLFTIQDLKELDRIRHEIHKYARKGPKKLKEYTFI